MVSKSTWILNSNYMSAVDADGLKCRNRTEIKLLSKSTFTIYYLKEPVYAINTGIYSFIACRLLLLSIHLHQFILSRKGTTCKVIERE